MKSKKGAATLHWKIGLYCNLSQLPRRFHAAVYVFILNQGKRKKERKKEWDEER